MWVKICANTNLADALQAAESGADAVGFVFAPSKRRITPEAASEIIDALPATVEKVGVFATDDPYEVEHFVACSGLTIAQLHTAYDPDFVRDLSQEFGGELKIIQTVAYELAPPERARADDAFAKTLADALADPRLYAVLIDAAKSGTSGGLGLAFAWKHVGALAHAANAGNKPIILAGGLQPENVAAAIAEFQPWGVDVASGVEQTPGKKDPARVTAFLREARRVP